MGPMTTWQCVLDFAVRLALVLVVGWAGIKMATGLEK